MSGTVYETQGPGSATGPPAFSGSMHAAQLHPLVSPQVSHLAHAPLLTKVSCPHAGQGSPSYPFARACLIRSASSIPAAEDVAADGFGATGVAA